MKSKIKPKSNNNTINYKQDKNRININDKHATEKKLSKNKNQTLQKISNVKIINRTNKENKTKSIFNTNKTNNKMSIEDSSTNCLSGSNNKKHNIQKVNPNLKNNQKKDDFVIPLLIARDSDTESLFINFKLGEKDSYTESTLRSDIKNYDFKNEKKNINNIKLNNNNIKNKYNHCEVDQHIGQNESNSFELYDFTDKSNIDYVLKNLSALSCSKSGKDKSSIIMDDINEEEVSGHKKPINKIKIFNTKQSLSNITSKIKSI